MENQQVTAKKFVLNYGILLGIVSVIYGVFMYVTNVYLDPSIIYGIISFLILIVLITLAIKAFKTENNGFLSLSEALKVGIGAAVIGGIIAAVWSFALTTYIEPDYTNQIMEVQREKMIETQPEMTETQIDTAIGMSSKLSSPPIAFAISLIGSLFFGLVISLIVGLIMKNKNPMEG
jgi:preprotein translocase subunit YajC